MTTEQEALEIADAITCFEGCNCDKNQAAAMLRKLVAEREADRAAMREVEKKIQWALVGVGMVCSRLRSETRLDGGTAVGNTESVDQTLRQALAAITHLLGETT